MAPNFCKSALLAALVAAPISQAQAHTNSIGYESTGPGAVTFWYGTYHVGVPFTEGSFSLVGQDVTYSSTVVFSVLSTTKPAGLVDGTNNFYSGGGATTLVAVNPGQTPQTWQGVSFTNLVAGTYQFTYIPISSPTAEWAPINAAILSSTLTLTAAALGVPSTIDGSQPAFTETDPAASAESIVFDGGVLAPTTAVAFEQPVSLGAAGGGVNVANGDLTFNNTISGPGQLVKDGPGTLVLNGDNTYSGGTVIRAGTVSGDADSLQGSIDNSGKLIFNQASADSFGGAISGSGSVTKTNIGQLSITGMNSYSGPTVVEGGRLAVNGSIANSVVTVGAGADIGGNGTIGGLIVRNNASASPGNSIGQLQVATFVVFEPLSRYVVEVNAAGQSDRVAATGTATLQGGTVQVMAENGAYQPATSYQILTAAGGVAGKFNAATSNLAFLTPVLAYDANSVTLTMVRNDLTFAGAGVTPNQVRTGAATDSAFRFGSAIYGALVSASTAQARNAFDGLSGEIHADIASAAVSDSSLLRGAMTARLVGARTQGKSVWGQAIGAWGKTDGDGNAAPVKRDTAGVLFGLEHAVGDSSLVGATAGYTQTDIDVNARASSATMKALNLGIYGGAEIGAARLRAGLGYAALDIDTDRSVSFRTFSDHLAGKYDGSTFQAFAEAGYATKLGGLDIEPFAGLSALRLRTDSAVEQGGTAALHVSGEDRDLLLTTLGLRSHAQFGAAASPITVQGMVGWRGASGDLRSASSNWFASGPAFVVAGAPLDRSSLVADLGLDWSVNDALAVRANYAGQVGEDVQDHAIKASVTYAF